MIHSVLVAASLLGFAGHDMEYTVNGVTMEGYVSLPAGNSKAPIVMIVHDWNGIDAYEKGRADQIAALGYIGFAADIYGKGVRPKNAQESGAESRKYYQDHALLLERLNGASAAIRKNPRADGKNRAAMGYCFGGMAVLEFMRSGADYQAVGSFHGALATQNPVKKGAFKGEVAIYHGADDPLVPQKDIDAVKAELNSAGIDYDFVAYKGAVHSFTVPGPARVGNGATGYDEAADKGSWNSWKKMLAAVFK